MSPLRKIAAPTILSRFTPGYCFVHGAVVFVKICHIFFFFHIQGNTLLNKLVEKLYFLHHGAITMQITLLL